MVLINVLRPKILICEPKITRHECPWLPINAWSFDHWPNCILYYFVRSYFHLNNLLNLFLKCVYERVQRCRSVSNLDIFRKWMWCNGWFFSLLPFVPRQTCFSEKEVETCSCSTLFSSLGISYLHLGHQKITTTLRLLPWKEFFRQMVSLFAYILENGSKR